MQLPRGVRHLMNLGVISRNTIKEEKNSCIIVLLLHVYENYSYLLFRSMKLHLIFVPSPLSPALM